MMEVYCISIKEFQDELLNYINSQLYPFPDVSPLLKELELSRKHQREYILKLSSANYIKRADFEEFNKYFQNINDIDYIGGQIHLSITDKGKKYLEDLERKATMEIENSKMEEDRQLDIQVKKSTLKRDKITMRTSIAAIIISIISLIISLFKLI